MAAMERRILGPKSEKLPPIDREVRKERPVDPAATLATRRKNAELRATRVVSEDVSHKVPAAERTCPKCNGSRSSSRRRREGIDGPGLRAGIRPATTAHSRDACLHVRRAHRDGAWPDHSVEGTRYGDSFRAFVVTSKCADAIPLYRQAKQMSRLGIPISRSTLTDLFHQSARQFAPLSKRLLELVAAAEVVQADETSLKMQKPNKRGFVWTFLAEKLIAYVFSAAAAARRRSRCWVRVPARSWSTCTPDTTRSRARVGRTGSSCLAHARRRFFDALSYAPEARTALELIRDVYVVEHDAKAEGIARTDEHTRLRGARSRPIMERLHTG